MRPFVSEWSESARVRCRKPGQRSRRQPGLRPRCQQLRLSLERVWIAPRRPRALKKRQTRPPRPQNLRPQNLRPQKPRPTPTNAGDVGRSDGRSRGNPVRRRSRRGVTSGGKREGKGHSAARPAHLGGTDYMRTGRAVTLKTVSSVSSTCCSSFFRDGQTRPPGTVSKSGRHQRRKLMEEKTNKEKSHRGETEVRKVYRARTLQPRTHHCPRWR